MTTKVKYEAKDKMTVFGLYEVVRNGTKEELVPRYVGYTGRKDFRMDLNKMLNEIKSHITNKKVTKSVVNSKMLNTNINVSMIKIKNEGNCFFDETSEKINTLIEKYNTIDNGWNVRERV